MNTDQRKPSFTVRDRTENTPSVTQPAAWEFADWASIRLLPLGTAFRPGAIYQLSYIAKDPPVTGIGFAATRDLVDFLRYDTSDKNPLAGTTKVAIAHGTSQSGRYLRDMVYRGFNETERGKIVFDGVHANTASARTFVNYRFAQPNRLYSMGFGFVGYPDASFPFSYARIRDTISGRMDSLLDRCTARKNCPKIIQTVTSTEYWQGGHSLNTTDLLGLKDVAPPANVRIYHLAGTEHTMTPTMPKNVCAGTPNTAVDARPALRAMIVSLDRWVKSGATPPPSRYPRIADKTLVTMNQFKLPQALGLVAPRGPNPMTQFNYGSKFAQGIIDLVPPVPQKKHYIALVPAVDADGNETGGLRLPEQAGPAQTRTRRSPGPPEGGGRGGPCFLHRQT